MASLATKPVFGRARSNFAIRTARDETSQLDRRESEHDPCGAERDVPELLDIPRQQSFSQLRPVETTLQRLVSTFKRPTVRARQRLSNINSEVVPEFGSSASSSRYVATTRPKPGALPRPVGGSEKLGTFAGVFVPTTLNVLSILMFLRFGFILGQSGLVGMIGMLVACYSINLLTTMSISAIASNGTVRGGGAYYLISRSLGPEFGGSIGIVFYLGSVFNTGMNAVGLVDCLRNNFGQSDGNWAQWLPTNFWWSYLWASIVLIICTVICLAGSKLFARASNALLVILLIATFSIPFSAVVLPPFESRRLGIQYTGVSLTTLRGNLYPQLTRGADGTQMKGRETWQDLIGILFPATGGIFAGASMSGDLKNPSKSIPRGTLYGLCLTFFAYTLVIMAMAATITRATFYQNVNVLQDVNISGILILLGEIATSVFSTLMGVIGSAKLLQALARDNLIPGLAPLGRGDGTNDEPTFAIVLTYLVAQMVMLSDINQIASLVTMSYLMTFLVMNLACFLLKISSAPNFRPSFRYFSWLTAATGAVASGALMFFVDGAYAAGCVLLLATMFLLIHYTTPPKSWGDVSQSLIYHQVRKYLLRLRQEHVKFWRPQILLLVNDPRRQYKLIQFCNSLKKGALFILGHVIVTQDFAAAVPEAKRQQSAWAKYIDFSKIKAFVNITISPAIEWGTRNLVLSTGLGGMRPNIVVMGAYNIDDRRKLAQADHTSSNQAVPQSSLSTSAEGSTVFSKSTGSERDAITVGGSNKRQKSRSGVELDKPLGHLPTDQNRSEHPVTAASYVTILEDLLVRLQINVAIARGFHDIKMPSSKPGASESLYRSFTRFSREGDSRGDASKKAFIDLWPIQMSAEIASMGHDSDKQTNVLTSNFDTYTLILQLGCILNTVPSWKRTHRLRVAVFVEFEADVEEERSRVKTLLSNLRIPADVSVFWLACGALETYEVIVNGRSGPSLVATRARVDELLVGEEWWTQIKSYREAEMGSLRSSHTHSAIKDMAEVAGLLNDTLQWPSSSFQHGPGDEQAKRFAGLRKMLRRKRSRRASVGGLSDLGVSLGMTTQRLHPAFVAHHPATESASESSSYSDNEGMESDPENSLVGYPSENREVGLDQTQRTLVDRPSGYAPSGRLQAELKLDAVPSNRNLGRVLKTPSPKHKSVNRSRSQSLELPLEDHQHALQLAGNTSRTRPSITFAIEPVPAELHASTGASVYDGNGRRTTVDEEARSEEGFASPPSSLTLSFNDLPCRAQHLILNELMYALSYPMIEGSDCRSGEGIDLLSEASEPLRHRIQAYERMTYEARGQTEYEKDDVGTSCPSAVLFTTLPCPPVGTGQSEQSSMKYLQDLEVLCHQLPPTLLVHSNSISVTMSL